MISWIQRTFQNHFKLVFILLLAVMVVPMIFIYSASGGIGNASGQAREVKLFGQSFSSDVERSRLDRAAALSRGLSQSQLASNAYARLALKQLADQLGIPQPTKAQLEEFVKTRPAFLGFDGQFDAQRYTTFRDNVTAGLIYGATSAEIQQILRDDWRLERVEQALTGPGYVADADVKRVFDERETLWSVQTASLDLTPIQPSSEPTEAELVTWFQSQSYRYEIPEQVVVNYVEFSPVTYLASIGEPTDDEIINYFANNKASYPPKPAQPAADGTTPPTVETTLADVREQVKNDVRQAKAKSKATEAASVFSSYLFENEILPDTPAFEERIKRENLAVKAAPAFARNEIPAGLAWETTATNAAFRLDEKNAVSDALRTRDGSTVVLFFRGKNPPTPVTLDQARARVVTDVKADKRRVAIVARGEELRRQFNAAVAAGQSFTEVAKAAGLEVKSWEKFKRTAPPADIDQTVVQNLALQKVREVSQMAVKGETGTFVLATARELPDPATAAEAFTSARQMVMQQYAGLAGELAISEVIKNERVAAGLPADER